LESKEVIENGQVEKIHDVLIRNCMLEASNFIQGDLKQEASARISEALGAFKFLLVGHFADFRTVDMEFKKFGMKIDIPNLFADFAIKIICGNDEGAIRLLLMISSKLEARDGVIKSQSNYPIFNFGNKGDVITYFKEVLRVILTYQDSIPLSIWRKS
jgi:hypothetical protein